MYLLIFVGLFVLFTPVTLMIADDHEEIGHVRTIIAIVLGVASVVSGIILGVGVLSKEDKTVALNMERNAILYEISLNHSNENLEAAIAFNAKVLKGRELENDPWQEYIVNYGHFNVPLIEYLATYTIIN